MDPLSEVQAARTSVGEEVGGGQTNHEGLKVKGRGGVEENVTGIL